MKSTLWKNCKSVKAKDLPKKEISEQKPETKRTYEKLIDTTMKTEEAKKWMTIQV